MSRFEDFLANAKRRPTLKRIVTLSSKAEIVGYEVKTPRWKAPKLNIAVLTDFHAMWPWSPLSATKRYVDTVNEIGPDIVFLLGDYTAAHHTPGKDQDPDEMAEILVTLDAPLGVHTILGNHDWLDDPKAKDTDQATSAISQALTKVGLKPLINSSRRVTMNGTDFWLVGMDSQCAPRTRSTKNGRHDPEAAFADVPDESLSILLAHEPDYFVFGDKRPTLQVSGHTHGGQMNLWGWRPFTPSEYSSRYAYGHVVEDGQHLIVSGGLGYTHVPLRIAVPPEITLIKLSSGEED